MVSGMNPGPHEELEMKKPSLKQLVKEHGENVKKGCTCAAPSTSGSMVFKPRSATCPMHGELAS